MKKEILKINLERFDSYIEKSDTKASFILAISGAILAAVFVEYKSVSSNNCILKILLVTSLIFLIMSIIYSMLVIVPRKSISSFKSGFYYKSISEMTTNEYKTYLDEINTEECFEEELFSEVRELAKICNKKMIKCEKASFFLILGIIFMSFIIIVNIVLL
ncbi:DUF5706 domain-containing protein [Clostridium septicum]|uniref:Pycsar system effector family protein n=1 Tax=Clostridium septicum TaxID=1504 RepID=UPI00272E7FD5|nr:Pycsar system effector family protein [Clostridium septicum]WLF70498.1 DUF5706 domain-containing protein [Clostridium septicum]